jgi:hypothetical protein
MIETSSATFDPIYVASLHPEVAALLKLPSASDQRISQATQLARAGEVIDFPIVCDGWDPFTTMQARQKYGMTWVPSMLQQPLGAPGGYALPGVTPEPGQSAYPTIPPPGSIKVSLDSVDYPPFAPVTPTPPSPITSPVGLNEYAGYFAATSLAREMFDTGQLLDGQVYKGDPRGEFTFHADPSPFAPEGETLFFTQP